MDALTAVAIGVLAGIGTGLIPGLHVNLLAALALLLPVGPEAALGLVAVGVMHTFVSILPTTYLGMPGEDALSVLPAHRLRMEGSAREAVRISLHTSMLAVLAVCLLAIPYRIVLGAPSVLPFLETIAPFALLAVPTWLVLRDASPSRAAACAILAAGLGWIALDWPVAGWVPGAATPLLPLLSGLFGVPTLLWAMRRGTMPPASLEPPTHMPRGTHRAGGRGVLAAAFTAVLPGLTAAVATSLAVPRRDPRHILATLSAVNTAHLCLAMVVLWITGRTRSGLAIAWTDHQSVLPWTILPPPDLIMVLATMLVVGALAVFATPWVEPLYERIVLHVRAGVPEAFALILVTGLVIATTGWLGCLLFAAAICIGCVPLAAGVRRVHLAASLSVPIGLKLAGL